MNYEELVFTGENAPMRLIRLPIGVFRRVPEGHKYVNIVELREVLADNPIFCESLRNECSKNLGISDLHQMHFSPVEENGSVKALEVEHGHFVSFAQLLAETPSVVARPGFLQSVMDGLFEITSRLHSQGIYHICYSPSNVFLRKGTNKVMLLSHGSFYLKMADPGVLYEGCLDYVAPEVLACGTVDERSDVYSLGKFFAFLFSVTDMPPGYRAAIDRAVSEVMEDRYMTVGEMASAFKVRNRMSRGVRTAVVVGLLSLLCVGVFFGLIPEPVAVDYVKPAPKTAEEDYLDAGFDPKTELGVAVHDSSGLLTPDEADEMKQYEKKCEEIFRKRYREEAERILSKIYNKDYMGASEKKFVAASQSVMDELVKAQIEIASQSDLSSVRSQGIATEIIEAITAEKNRELTKHGIQK
ncbi:MAG: hypothetical protein J6K19_07455 [Prevotella sp.]|nr:hypothetical protein [Prevotella sp.]